jgi:hypothetical protein
LRAAMLVSSAGRIVALGVMAWPRAGTPTAAEADDETEHTRAPGPPPAGRAPGAR